MYVYTQASDENTEFRIAKTARGYAVTLWDNDAGMPLPAAVILGTLPAAIAYVNDSSTLSVPV